MNRSQELQVIDSIAKHLKIWIEETACNEDWDFGFWYDGQEYDMAVTAAHVLFASANGQQKRDEELLP